MNPKLRWLAVIVILWFLVDLIMGMSGRIVSPSDVPITSDELFVLFGLIIALVIALPKSDPETPIERAKRRHPSWVDPEDTVPSDDWWMR